MIQKILVLVMVTALFISNSFAASNNGLKAAFDELNYSLTVEWDQKDKDFYSARLKEFSSAIEELRAQGLTNEDLVAFTKKEAKNKQLAQEIEDALKIISLKKMSAQDANAYLLTIVKKSYTQGASWNGSTSSAVLTLGIFVALVVVLAVAFPGCKTDCPPANDYYYNDHWNWDPTWEN